ncbi:MAG TPA: ATP-binding protein [Pyrinomonadaceae bacterium]|jgi:signal transduction histidine kinase
MNSHYVTKALSPLKRYGAAALFVAGACLLTQALWTWVAPHPTPLFLAAVMLAALYGGRGASLLATALAALAIDYLFIEPTGGIELSVDNAVRTAVFVSVALLISWINAARRRAEEELRRHAMQQATVADLGQRALAGVELSALMDAAVSAVARRLDAESVAIWEFHPDRETLAVKTSVGWTAEFLRHAEVGTEADSMLTRALRSAEPVVVTDSVVFTSSGGEPLQLRREARACVSLAVPGRGRPFGVLSVYTDSPQGFSEEDVHFVRAAANVLSSAAERERTEAERSRLLLRAEEARGEAEAASRAKDGFLAMVSHELRAPLSVIAGWATMLRERGADEQMRAEALDKIVRNVELQKHLIEDLIDVSRITAGRLRIDARPADLVPVIEDAVETVTLAARAKGIHIETSYCREAGRVVGDPDRLRQVVWNLLSNAVKFTPDGGRVEVLLEKVGDYGRITVCDTGAGIDPALLPHVFEPFRQGEGALFRGQMGLGLGLSIVRHIVEAHGGAVAADSAGEGRGATFTVTLPVSGAFRAGAADADAVGRAGAAGVGPARGALVLLPGPGTPAA